MGKIINGVPNVVVYAGGAFAIYWFFFRGGSTFDEPILGVVRAKTESERYLAQRARAGRRGQLIGSEWERVDPQGRRIT